MAGAVIFAQFQRSRPPIDERIVVSGNIELNEVNIAFKTAGRLIERSVNEGDPVRAGQIIARLDRDQLAAAARAGTGRAGLGAGATGAGRDRGELAARDAGRRSGAAPRRHPGCRGSPGRTEERRAPAGDPGSQSRRDSAEAELDRAKRDWDRAQVLHKNDDISTSQFDQFRNRFETAEAQAKQARERYDLVVAGPRKEQIDAAPSQVERSRAALRVGEANTLEVQAARAGDRHAPRRDRAGASAGRP